MKVPGTYKGNQHRIPACDKCGEDLVMFRGKWLCEDCMTIPISGIGFGNLETVPFKELFTNRAARRAR